MFLLFTNSIMKEFTKNIKDWLIVSAVVIIIMITSQVIFIKARQVSNSTTDTQPSEIYTNPSEVITAAKWNTMVDKSNNITLSQQYTSNATLSTTATSWADTDMSITMTTPSGHVLLLMDWSTRNGSSTQRNAFIFNIDGTNVVSSTLGNVHVNQSVWTSWKTVSISRLASVTAWSHTFKVKRKTSWWTAYMNDGVGTHSRQFQVIVLP